VSAALCPLAALLVNPRIAIHATAAAKPTANWRVLFRPEVRTVPVLAFSVNFLNALLTTLFPLYVLAIGQTLAVVGTARALQSVANTVVRPLSEPFVRRVGVIVLGSAGVALTALAIVALPLSALPLVLLALFTVVGVGRAVGIVANAFGTMELSGRGVLTRGTASALMSGSGDAGSIIAPLIAGTTAAQIGIGPALQVLAVAAAALTVVALLTSRAKSDA
jgi:MFS family permease